MTVSRIRRLLPRFSLRTLVVFLLLVTSGMGLWWHWDAWYVERVLADNPAAARHALFSRKGNLLLTYGGGGCAYLWDIGTGRRLFALGDHEDAPSRGECFAGGLTPDSRRVLRCRFGSWTEIWDVETATRLLKARALVRRGCSQRWLVLESDPAPGKGYTETGLLDAQTLAETPIPGGAGDYGISIISVDGELVVTGYPGLGGTTYVVRRRESGAKLCEFSERPGSVLPAEFSPCGCWIVTSTDSPQIKMAMIRRATDGECVAALRLDQGQSWLNAFSRDGSLYLVHGRTPGLWDIERGRWIDEPPMPVRFAYRRYLDRERVLCMARGSVHVVDGKSGRTLAVLEGSSAQATGFPFSPGGDRVVTCPRENFEGRAPEDGFAPMSVYRRRRPEWWWGVFWLWEFWLTVAFAALLVWSILRDRKHFRVASA